MKAFLTVLLVSCVALCLVGLFYNPYPGRSSEAENEADIIKSRDWGSTDTEVLAKVSQYEAGDQLVETRELIVLVVLNRLWCKGFGDTLEEVAERLTDGNYINAQPTEADYEAVYHVQVEGWELDNLSQGALYYAKDTFTKVRYKVFFKELYNSGDFTFYKKGVLSYE